MKRTIGYLLIIFLSISCCQDEVVAFYQIPEDKEYLVPFEEDSKLTYISQQDITFSASATQKKMGVIEERTGPDSCNLWAFETLKSSVFIEMFEINMQFILSRGFDDDDFRLSLIRVWGDGDRQEFQIENCDVERSFSEDLFTDIEINGFLYEDVLIFRSCYTSHISQIIYSPENGIEYIDFSDGRFLRLKKS